MEFKSEFKGRLIAIGGNEDRIDELIVLKRVVKEICKKNYKVAVLTTASEEPKKRGEEYRKVFQTLGAELIEILSVTTRKQANDESVVKRLENIDLIFITGGDQLRLTTLIGGSRLLQAMKQKLEKGCLVVGTSAGAAVFSDTMIYEGRSEEGLLKGKVLTTSGFGFVDNVVFDTHFLTRGRIGRLVQIVTTNPECIGVGLGEDSGVVFDSDGSIEIIGSGQVILVDGSKIGHSNIMNIKPGEAIAVENILIHSLVHGYCYNLKKRKFLEPVKNLSGGSR